MTRREIFNKVLQVLSERQQKLLMNINENDFRMKGLLKELNKDIDKLVKIKGIIKLEKGIKKAKKRFNENVNYIYETWLPSHETFIFHCLLEAMDKLNYIMSNRTKLIKLTQERTGVSIETIENKFSKNLDFKPHKFSDMIKKEVVQIDIRCSNFLDKIVEYNDAVVNNVNLFNLLQAQKKTVKITDEIKIINYKEHSDFLNDIIKVIAVGITILEEVETKYTHGEKKQFKYNFTRLKNITLNLIEIIEVADELVENSEFKSIVYNSFKLEGEIPTKEAFESYTEYLNWLKGKKKLKSELQLLNLSAA